MVSKKQEQEKDLAKIKRIFESVHNFEEIILLHKSSGFCLFFKIYNVQSIAPRFLSKLLTTVFSFGNNQEFQEVLNEIELDGKNILISDGEFIRVAIVLSIKSSMLIQKSLRKFITFFEDIFAKDLSDWKGQLELFKNVEIIIEQFLYPKIILPHRINFQRSNIEAVLTVQSGDIFKIANGLVEQTHHNFFFIKTLLSKAMSDSKIKIQDIFKSIKDLRYKKIILPIDNATSIQHQKDPLNQALIKQKISDSTDLSLEDNQSLTDILLFFNPIERLAYLYCLEKQKAIDSPPFNPKIANSDIIIEDEKTALKEFNKLKKNARALKKAKDFHNTISFSKVALTIGTKWSLTEDFEELDDLIRQAKIEDLKKKLIDLKIIARTAVEEGNNAQATKNYQVAYKIAMEIFNLGDVWAAEQVKKLANSSIRYTN